MSAAQITSTRKLPTPAITGVLIDSHNIMKFTLSGINVSFANAIRRTILTEIPINVIRTETEAINQCVIHENTSRMHNEIVKQRLSCIPIHHPNGDLQELPEKYELIVRVENNTDTIIYCTTQDFQIVDKRTKKPHEQTSSIFPPDPITHRYIDFLRLRPKMSDMIPGERIHLTAQFSIATAKENSMFNVVSICTYTNTIDMNEANKKWIETEKTLPNTLSIEDKEFHKRNFYLLDACRCCVENSFDFKIQSIGIYQNDEIVRMACEIMQTKMIECLKRLKIARSETTIPNCFDVSLEEEDYTVGKVFECVLYDLYFVGKNKLLSFVGFKKFHPHDVNSMIRIAFIESSVQETEVKDLFQTVVESAIEIFQSISVYFNNSQNRKRG